MRVAVACNGLEIAPRYDLCEGLTFYTITRGIITECQNIPNPRIDQAELVDFFLANDISTLICDAIIIDHAKLYCSNNIEVVAGIKGNARSAVEAYLSKQLSGADQVCEWDDDEDELSEEDAATLTSLESILFQIASRFVVRKALTETPQQIVNNRKRLPDGSLICSNFTAFQGVYFTSDPVRDMPEQPLASPTS